LFYLACPNAEETSSSSFGRPGKSVFNKTRLGRNLFSADTILTISNIILDIEKFIGEYTPIFNRS